MSDEERRLREVERQKHVLEEKLKNISKVIIRMLVILKYLFRIGAIVGLYFWLGKYAALSLFGFICLIATLQLGIDKVQKTLHPGCELSEWDLD